MKRFLDTIVTHDRWWSPPWWHDDDRSDGQWWMHFPTLQPTSSLVNDDNYDPSTFSSGNNKKHHHHSDDATTSNDATYYYYYDNPTKFPTQRPVVDDDNMEYSTGHSHGNYLPTIRPSRSYDDDDQYRTPARSGHHSKHQPSCRPSFIPTHGRLYSSSRPSLKPSSKQSSRPTISPSTKRSVFPSSIYSSTPSNIPTLIDSNIPTPVMSESPSYSPSSIDTLYPSYFQSLYPTKQPIQETIEPTWSFPSMLPSSVESISPSSVSSEWPTNEPSIIFGDGLHTSAPSEGGSNLPYIMPSYDPSISNQPLPSEIENQYNQPSFSPTSSQNVDSMTLLSPYPSEVPSTFPSLLEPEISESPSVLKVISNTPLPENYLNYATATPTLKPNEGSTISLPTPDTIRSCAPTSIPTINSISDPSSLHMSPNNSSFSALNLQNNHDEMLIVAGFGIGIFVIGCILSIWYVFRNHKKREGYIVIPTASRVEDNNNVHDIHVAELVSAPITDHLELVDIILNERPTPVRQHRKQKRQELIHQIYMEKFANKRPQTTERRKYEAERIAIAKKIRYLSEEGEILLTKSQLAASNCIANFYCDHRNREDDFPEWTEQPFKEAISIINRYESHYEKKRFQGVYQCLN